MAAFILTPVRAGDMLPLAPAVPTWNFGMSDPSRKKMLSITK